VADDVGSSAGFFCFLRFALLYFSCIFLYFFGMTFAEKGLEKRGGYVTGGSEP
jgi:hypothetical protein